MGQRPSDATSILWASAALWKLGCPELRSCQGDRDLEQRLGSPSYKRTPDMVAGPIEGGASPRDFYIDVAELQGETLYNPKRPGGVPPPAMLVDPTRNHGTLSGADMPSTHFDGYLSTLNGKLAKYSTERGGTPLVGLCIHLDASAIKSNATLSRRDMIKFVTRIDYLRFLEAVFGVYTGKALHDSFDRLFGEDRGPAVLFFPVPYQFTFLMHTVKMSAPSDLRVLLLVNDAALDGPFRDHAVLTWLRTLREGADTMRLEGGS
jgi:hypothetical protein